MLCVLNLENGNMINKIKFKTKKRKTKISGMQRVKNFFTFVVYFREVTLLRLNVKIKPDYGNFVFAF